jgi:hypothetical protein
MTKGLTPKNWADFQHYKDRSPVWIKLHRVILDNYEFHCLPVASRALAPMLWLLASEYTDGKITASVDAIAFRLRMPVNDLVDALKPLINADFFIDDSNLLADCYQEAIPEKERETETQDKTETDISSVSGETRRAVLQFDSFKKAYPKRGASNPWQPAFKLFNAAVKRGADPESIIRAAGGYRAECDNLKTTATDKVAQAQTWLRQERWRDYLDGTEADEARRAANRAAAEAKGWRWIDGAWIKPDETAIGG